jgi:hypothetical protein|tara:strand:- start:1087 stop:1446 length:360 start_codon:yes stop_codon:yes gene_type:complete
MARLSAKNLTVPQMKANAAGIKAVIATKPKGDPTGMGLKGQDLTGAAVNKKKGGSVKKKKKKLNIKKAIKKPGSLRKALGIKKGETIPASKLNKAAKAKGKLGQRARFAKTLAKLRKKK